MAPFRARATAGGQTTHISAMDRWGNAVGITQSVNLVYASKAAAQGSGLFYNDYLLDCNTTDFKHPNYLRPGGKPASTVAPVIALHARGFPGWSPAAPAASAYSPPWPSF
jgi:gamma-glutamyltranspeptidase/glutathione hydrolase